MEKASEIDTILDRIVSICEDAIGTRGAELAADLKFVSLYLERIKRLNKYEKI